MQDHCWNYILRNWHFLQRTPTFKTTLPADARQRLSAEVKDSLVSIASRESPGDKAQSTGFSVLWDASNTQDDSAGANALGPDGKRPVSKATEKRRQRLLEQQQQEQQQVRAKSARLGHTKTSFAKSGSAGAAWPSAAQSSAAQPSAASSAQLRRRTAEAPDSTQARASSNRLHSASARQPTNATEHTGSTGGRSAGGTATRAVRPSTGVAAVAQPRVQSAKPQSRSAAGTPTSNARAQAIDRPAKQGSRRQTTPDMAPPRPTLQRVSSQMPSGKATSSSARPAFPEQALFASRAAASPVCGGANQAGLRDGQIEDMTGASAYTGASSSEHNQALQGAELQQSQESNSESPIRSLSQLQQLRRLSLGSKPTFR